MTARSKAHEGAEHSAPSGVLLATEGREISEAAIERAAELARASGGYVRVLSIARVHGVAFGLQSPGLAPTRREWQEQREIVTKAVKSLKRLGIEADGHVVGTRKSTKRICQEAVDTACGAIVMGADPDRVRIIGDMLWTQEPQRVRRRAKVPVHLVIENH